jgi:hypothetical protein
MRKYLLVTLLATAVVATACKSGDTASDSSGPATQTAAGEPASVSAAPAASADEQRLRDAMLTDDQLSTLAMKPSKAPSLFVPTDGDQFSLVAACVSTQPSDAKVVRAEQASWEGESPAWKVHQWVASYDGVTGADVVAGVKKALPCSTPADDTLPDTKYVEEPNIPQVPGADAQFAFCPETLQGPLSDCYLVTAQGNLVSGIDLTRLDSGVDRQAMHEELVKIAAAANTSLVKD